LNFSSKFETVHKEISAGTFIELVRGFRNLHLSSAHFFPAEGHRGGNQPDLINFGFLRFRWYGVLAYFRWGYPGKFPDAAYLAARRGNPDQPQRSAAGFVSLQPGCPPDYGLWRLPPQRDLFELT